MSPLARAVVALAVPLVTAAAVAADPPPGKRYAVVVGVNEYQHDKLPALKYAEADAGELGEVLAGLGYQVTALTGKLGSADPALAPTKANIEARLEAVLAGCRKGDIVVVAFAGHGVQFEGQPDAYFCPADARPFPDATGSLVSLAKVYAGLDKSFAGMKVLFVDACRDDPTAGRGARGVDADAAPKPPTGVAALFSCRAGERAFEHDTLKHGVFFHHVLEGLKGKATDADGEVTFAGLSAYVTRRVSREVPTLIGGGAKQSPNLKADYSAEPVLVVKVEVTVAPAGQQADFASVADAVTRAPAGSVIRIKPGTYQGAVVIEKSLELIGDGGRGAVVIEASDGSGVSASAPQVSLKGLTIRCTAPKSDTNYYAGVVVWTGKAVIEDCAITSSAGISLDLNGPVDVTARNCRVADGASAGIMVHKNARGTFEGCEVTGSTLAGVEITDGSNPTFLKCRVTGGKAGGVFAHDGGRGLVEDCQISGNALAQVEVGKDSDLSLVKCRIADGQDDGVLFHTGARGTLDGCEITGNKLNGVESKEQAAPKVVRCRIAHNKGGGIYAQLGGNGTFEDCDVVGNALCGVGIADKADPLVTKCRISNGKEGGVLVMSGGLGTIDDCDIANHTLAGIEVREKSNPKFTKCRVTGGKAGGILVDTEATGTFEDCDVSGPALAGIEVREKADPVVTRCKFRNGKGGGAFVYGGGKGTYDDCDFSGNALAGFEVKEKGDALLKGCRLADGQAGGVFVHADGRATVTDCDITGNALCGVEVKAGGAAVVRSCRIHKSGFHALLAHERGVAAVEDSDLTNNAQGAFSISEDSAVTQKNNRE